jgi:polysaccharide export outer membrane protein
MKIMSSAKILQKMTALIALALAFSSGPLSAWETEDEASNDDVDIADSMASAAPSDYLVNPGDVIAISVWRETDLRADVLVRPDGKFSFPLAGDIQAQGNSVERIRQEVTEKLNRYIPDPVVSVSVLQINGNKIYVIGQVNRPGDINANPQLDVLQALSLAGGTTPFAQANDISILRRTEKGIISIPFRYGDIEKGKRLEQNIMLQAGDVVVVP